MEFLKLSNISDSNEPNMEILDADSKNIAIIGMSGQFPSAGDTDEYWENILNQIECIRKLPADRKADADRYLKMKGIPEEKIRYLEAAYIDKIDEFDPKIFHLSPKEAKLMDPRQRLFLQHAWRAIEDAGYRADELRGQKIGVYSGFSNLGGINYIDILTDIDKSLLEMGLSGNLQAIIPSRVSYLLDLKGPSMVIDTACSSSLVALHTACRALRNGECDAAIVGSVRIHLVPLDEEYKIGIESKDGRTKAFDESATGTGLGEGAVSIFIKPMQKALMDGDHIYALIKGTAINQDGNSIGITAPNSDAQAAVIEQAWKDAGISPKDISYIEAHGTGTRLGDPIEIDGLTKAFSEYKDKKQFCGIGSVKNNIGHTYEVSGLASVIKCIYALNNKILPPTINFKESNKEIDFVNSPVYVNIKAREWNVSSKKRICAVSSFGFSGTNCHVVLEEPEERERTDKSLSGFNILPISGQSAENLKELAKRYLRDFYRIQKENPNDVCFTASVGRNHYQFRLAILFRNYRELKDALENYLGDSDEKMPGILFDSIEQNESPLFTVVNQDQLKYFDLNTPMDELTGKMIAVAYCNGQTLDWTKMYSSMKRKRVRLPTYSFSQKKYWITIKDPSEQVTGNAAKLSEDWNFLQGKTSDSYTETEKSLGRIIKEIMEFDNLNIYENFYELGGDSLIAMKIYSKINEVMRTKLTVADVFSYPTIDQLAKRIDESHSEKENEPLQEETADYKSDEKEIAIIGMAGRFPGAGSIRDYWNVISTGRNCIREIPENRKADLVPYLNHLGFNKDEILFEKAGYLDEIDKFDYEFFGLSAKEATLMDPVHRCMLENAFETFEDAGYCSEKLAGSNTGVFIGYEDDYKYNYRRFIYDSEPSLTKSALSGNLNSILASRISYTLDLRGPSYVIDSACSSSMTALNNAVRSVQSGECSMAFIGSAKIKLLPIFNADSFVGVESEQFRIRAFDEAANGTVEGEAVCSLLIKPLKKAIADGDHVRAVIKGISINQDGTGMGVMAPRAETQKEVLMKAWKNAGITPETIQYVETHGTGTKLGDLIEYEALKKAFGEYTERHQFCALSSVKTNVGHLFQASGIASIIKAVLSLEHKKIPPMINFERPNQLIDFEDSPFYVNDIEREWRGGNNPRRCGVSSFGLSGTNCHVILEEYTQNSLVQKKDDNHYIITISAKSQEALLKLIHRYYDFLTAECNIDLGSFSFTVNTGRNHHKYRLALVVGSLEDLAEKLGLLLKEEGQSEKVIGVFSPQKYPVPSLQETLAGIDEMKKAGKVNEEVLNALCKLYVAGNHIPWELLYHDDEKKIISIPSYPFKKSKCWFKPRIVNSRLEMMEGEEEDYGWQEDLSQPFENEFDVSFEGVSENLIGRDQIMRIFENVLGKKSISLDDNFFELGGNSLKATILTSQIYLNLEILLPLSDILAYPSIGGLINHIDELVEENRSQMLEAIPVLPEQELYDLSLKQLDLWLSAQIYEEESSLNITWASMLHSVNIETFIKALKAVVERHPIMSSQIVIRDGVPKQRMEAYCDFSQMIRYLDISEAEDQDKAIMGILTEEVRKQFNLENEPLIRITLSKVDKNKYLFLFVISHMIADWWSMDIIIHDLSEYYQALYTNTEAHLEPLLIGYHDYAQWHRKRVETNEELKTYWSKVLHGPLPVLNLITDYPRPAVKGQTGRKYTEIFSEIFVSDLKRLSDMNQGTMFMTLLTGVYTLLHIYSGQKDIIIGTNSSGREHPQLQNQVGYFINSLPLRLEVEGDNTFSTLYPKVKGVVLGALENQDYPFSSMLALETVTRDPGRSPIFDIMVQYLNDPNCNEILAGNARMKEITYDSFESKYDIIFNFIENNREIVLEIEYSNHLFKEETIRRMIDRFKMILNGFIISQEITLNKLKVEEKKLVVIKKRGR